MQTKKPHWISILIVILWTIQTSILSMPGSPGTVAVVSGILLLAVNILTPIHQFISAGINNKALWPSLILLGISIVGGVLDASDALPFGAAAALWVRWGLTTLGAILNAISKLLFPIGGDTDPGEIMTRYRK